MRPRAGGGGITGTLPPVAGGDPPIGMAPPVAVDGAGTPLPTVGTGLAGCSPAAGSPPLPPPVLPVGSPGGVVGRMVVAGGGGTDGTIDGPPGAEPPLEITPGGGFWLGR